MKKFKIANSEITFRIDIDFENCDVDMVYNELRAEGVQTPVSFLAGTDPIPINKSKLSKTPTSESVQFCLHWLAGYVNRNTMEIQSSKWEKDYTKQPIKVKTDKGFEFITFPDVTTELEDLGLKVIEWSGLMMGTCHLICSCDLDKFSLELVSKANEVVEKVFNKYCKFYKK